MFGTRFMLTYFGSRLMSDKRFMLTYIGSRLMSGKRFMLTYIGSRLMSGTRFMLTYIGRFMSGTRFMLTYIGSRLMSGTRSKLILHLQLPRCIFHINMSLNSFTSIPLSLYYCMTVQLFVFRDCISILLAIQRSILETAQ